MRLFRGILEAIDRALAEPVRVKSLVNEPLSLEEDMIVNKSFEIQGTPDGRYALLDGKGNVVGSYARRRDAIRGAERKFG